MEPNEQFNELTSRLYDELLKLARHIRASPARPGFQTTSLVHEAYLRLADKDLPFQNKQHFMRVAATAMRRLLVDQWRRDSALKRGGESRPESLELATPAKDASFDADLLALDEALDALAEVDARKCAVVELRYFGGCTFAEVADTLAISTTSAHREWDLAKSWLYQRLSNND